jgi:hypothetical protein
MDGKINLFFQSFNNVNVEKIKSNSMLIVTSLFNNLKSVTSFKEKMGNTSSSGETSRMNDIVKLIL